MIEIGGKQRPIHGNINALIELKKEHGIDLINGADTKDFEVIRAIVFICLKYGAKKEKQEIDFTVEDIGEWLSVKSMLTVLQEVLPVLTGEVEMKGGSSGESPGALSEK